MLFSNLGKKENKNQQTLEVGDKMNFNINQNNIKSIKIDPSIFVSLKKGSITTTYKLGNVLGEGCYFIEFVV